MNDQTLEAFREIARLMYPEAHDWQWIGQYISQRHYGITEARAKEFAARFGGTAQKMGAR